MKLIYKLSLLILLFCGCSKTTFQNCITEKKLNEEGGSDVVLLVNSGTMLRGKEIEIDNVNYGFAFQDGKIVYIETQDDNFMCDERLSMASTIADCLMTRNQIEMEPGIGLFMRLNNGWRVYLPLEGDTLRLSDKVLYFCFIDDKLSNSIDLQSWINSAQSIIIPKEQESQEGKVLFIPMNNIE